MIGVVMISKMFAELDHRLAIKGHKHFFESSEKVGDDTIIYRFYDFGNKTVRISEGVREGLSCWVSQKTQDCSFNEGNWKSIYSLTVEGFDKFSEAQMLDWVINAPQGDSYIDQLEKYISQLK